MSRVIAILIITVSGVLGAYAVAAQTAADASKPPLTAQEFADIQSAAAKGDPSAELRLARAYETGNGVARSRATAADWYRKAAEAGNAEAQDATGIIYMTGDGVTPDKVQAVNWYQKSARQGYANAMFNLGTAYYNGDGVPSDQAYAFAWFTLAKEAGSAEGAQALDTTAADRKPWNVSDGYKVIAGMYAKDGFFGANPAQATRWFLLAAQNGDLESQLISADTFLNGRGVPQDFAAGRHWCEEAAKSLDVRSFYCLGEIYRRGLGVKPNYSLARADYEHGARQNSALAIRALAEMDVAGEGGKRDLESACVRYAILVLGLGHADDTLRLKALRAEMPPKHWSEVEKKLVVMHLDPSKLDHALQSTSAP